MLLIYAVIIVVLLYYLYTKNYSFWKDKNVAFEKPFLIFGNFYKVATRKLHISQKMEEIYTKFKNDPYVGIFIFNQPLLLIRDPEILKDILVKDSDKFINRMASTNEKVDPILAHSLFRAQDQVWENLRTKISPAFSSGKLKLMFPLMNELAIDLRNCMAKFHNEIFEARSITKRYSADIIFSCAFGINSYCLRDANSELLSVATKLLDLDSFVRTFSVFSSFFMPKAVDILRLTFLDSTASDRLIDIFDKTIKERKKQNIVRHDLIDLLNNLKSNEKFNDEYKFDDIKMASQAVAFFSAGNDTTYLTMAYTLYELALSPQIQNKLRNELVTYYDKYGDFTYDCLSETKYLDMVIDETLRKYPLVSFLNRKSGNQYTFSKTGLSLEKDTPVLVPITALHMDPEYFSNPHEFNPERFSEENKHLIHPYTYLPFGDGPRSCIGQRFALLVVKIGLAHCVKDYVFEKAGTTSDPLVLQPGSIFPVCKDSINLKIKKLQI